MKLLTALSILCLLLLSAGCASSLNPIYTDEDLVFDRALVGVWTDADQTESWEFTYRGDKEYKLVHTDEAGKRGEFQARLFKIGGKTFLDLTPVLRSMPQNDFYQGHFLAVHSFVQVVQTGPSYQISYLEPKWLKAHLAKEPAAVAHTLVADDILFTDTTKNLQKFLAAHINTPGAFSEPVSVKRKDTAK